ncbi:MarR family winged helix-turn-helix transcriptional regulator [Brevibacterium album]|uniref:MarR family winged helix-turn-helix transcriptional regulator n=1 Tax=Brevibacterium album TaxID=417948 RepID=UPI00040069B1|nr:MarR family transcriptional regulator [Brevibacterium album]
MSAETTSAAEFAAPEHTARERDEVDRIVAAWRSARPDIDVTPMEILSRVTRLSRQLDRKRKAVFSSHGLEIWAFDVLSALRRAGEPYELSPTALTEEMLVTSGTMTNRIDRLTTAGWVSRHRTPTDRRGVLVRLTDAGRGKVDGALADFVELESRLLEELADAERAALAGSLRHLLACVEAVGEPSPEDDDRTAPLSQGGHP